MVSGGTALIFLLIAIIAIVLMTGRLKMNAFLVLLLVAFGYGFAIGIPPLEVVKLVKEGFGGTLTNIGIVIVAGTVMGLVLERTGAALALTRAILNLIGERRAPLSMNIAGYVVSIPVFCDSGFVLMNPLNKALSKQTGTSMAVMAVSLATGLYATHTLVPPTPGPIAAAGALGADLGRVILFGLIASLPAALSGWYWARKVASKFDVQVTEGESYQTLLEKHGKLPSALHALVPILLPIVLILLNSVAALPSKPFGDEFFAKSLIFLGDPVVALVIGMLTSFTLIGQGQSLGEAFSTWINDGIKDSALILVITAAGGSFGKVLGASPLKSYISETLADPKLGLGLFLPFIISAALKTAQGSSTVAIITTAGIMAPLLGTLGLDPALTVLAIGAGAMVISHANDSYFWVVSQFSGLQPTLAYKVYSTATLVEGTVGFLVVWILSFFV